MSKKKTPATSRKTTRKTEAPKLVSRPVEDVVVAAAPVVVEPAPVVVEAAPVTVDRAQIARLAFAKYAQRGYTHGLALEDWLSAEAELRAQLR